MNEAIKHLKDAFERMGYDCQAQATSSGNLALLSINDLPRNSFLVEAAPSKNPLRVSKLSVMFPPPDPELGPFEKDYGFGNSFIEADEMLVIRRSDIAALRVASADILAKRIIRDSTRIMIHSKAPFARQLG